MTQEQQLLIARLEDSLKAARKRPVFLGFLDEAQAAFCQDFLARRREVEHLFWGGHPDAERVMLGFFPDYLEPGEEHFPVTPFAMTFRKGDSLSHRDFLGSFMALGVERSVVGDILVGEGECVAFLRKEMGDYFLQNIRKIGRVGVKTSLSWEGPLPGAREFKEMSGVIASERLDCLVGFACRTSREKAAGLITAGLVFLNHREALSVSQKVKEGDQLSVRHQGRFTIDQLGPLTSKGRLVVKCRKYQ
ncbi:MAG: RNA-binding protein [Acutalibacter sp.]|jgi:RNA-binding protein YlmH